MTANHFSRENTCTDSILVSRVACRKITLAFFVTEDKGVASVFGPFFDLFTDVFEAGKNAYVSDTVLFADSVEKVGGNYRFNSTSIFGKISVLLSDFDNVVDKECADLVAGKCEKFALVVFVG